MGPNMTPEKGARSHDLPPPYSREQRSKLQSHGDVQRRVGVGRRDPAVNSDPRPAQDYQNGSLNSTDSRIGTMDHASNLPFAYDPQDQQYQTNNYMQQHQLPIERANNQSNGYVERSEPITGRRYGPSNYFFTPDPRAQQNGYMQRNQTGTEGCFQRFGGIQDTGRGYDDMNDYGSRRNGGRRRGGPLQRRRDRKAERGGGLLHMAFGALSGMMEKK